ncbi:hypothetical protein HK098_004841 [Nowakowskiella sp. JEL0407]|nr:hypothetical protein HK098_004841 [Nowakowskiella sp. JEL0407]
MDLYRRTKVGDDEEIVLPHELVIATQGKIKNYVSRISDHFKSETLRNNELVISGKGRAINKTVSVAEIVKRNFNGQITQETEITSVQAIDTWDPIEENLDKIKVIRHLPKIIIRLKWSGATDGRRNRSTLN